MEPQWNPTVEEQALARIHRMGQTKEVTTVRFFMEQSFEQVRLPISFQLKSNVIQHVLEMQSKKKSLAKLLLSSDRKNESEQSLEKLRVSDGIFVLLTCLHANRCVAFSLFVEIDFLSFHWFVNSEQVNVSSNKISPSYTNTKNR